MNREQVERITTGFVKPIYGFALKRCSSLQDAEDLTQEIVLRVFSSLLRRDNIESAEKFVWTVAHNTLANYYRDKIKSGIGICINDLAEILPSNDDTLAGLIERETTDRLHMEIAYLSKLQRRIVVAYYYENKKQEAIAKDLGIPLGTVKWHLFEAKKDLKKGMDIMRQTNELKFNPIKFAFCGTNGLPGTKGANNNFFRSALSQNIVYSVWKEAKTVNEIADCLGVSPVYVESEAEFLSEYGFLTESKGKYLCNTLLDEANDEITQLHDEMYQKVSRIFANELYDELLSSEILKDNRIICNQDDENFLMWSLIPFIAALSGESLMNNSISFDEATTLRPDGGQNICYASILTPDEKPSLYSESMSQWFGPCWNSDDSYTLWQIDSEWSAERVDDSYYNKAMRILSLYSRENNEWLAKEDYAFLSEMGFIKIDNGYDKNKKSNWEVVRLDNVEIKNQLLEIGDKIKEKHWAEFEALKAPFVKAVLNSTPKQLQKMQKFGLQYTFFSDGWFVLHCIKELINNGRLKEPTPEQKKSLTTLIYPNK